MRSWFHPKVVCQMLFAVILVLAVNTTFLEGLSWHDHQRIFQLIIVFIASVAVLFIIPTPMPVPALGLVITICLLGFISSVLAEHTLWALKEWARYIALWMLVLFVGQFAKETKKLTMAALFLMALVGFLNAYQFLVYYTMAFVTKIYVLDADVLFYGFTNPRFLNQFQVLLMPALAFLFVQQWRKSITYHRVISIIILLTLVVHWCIAFTLGGRGLWLGLGVSHLILLFAFPRFRWLLGVQLASALLGFLLFYLMFVLVPGWLELSPTLRDGLRTTLSAREIIWQQAWELFLAHPWLGVGPMHFSAYINPEAAHPHQVVLQWLSEWGLFATICASALVMWGVWHGILWNRTNNAHAVDATLWLSIVGALVLAQVDGVFVMPYTETWLAILVGLAMGRWTRFATVPVAQKYLVKGLALPALIVMGFVLIYEVPTVALAIEAYLESHNTGYRPRFWIQGFIPM